MFKHILVPLDGSHLAEAALPAAVSLAQTLKAPVTLLHIIEQDAPESVHQDRHLTDPAEAEAYLKDVANRFKVRVETHVHTAPVEDVARSIVDHAADEFQPDLIILTSHGNGGMHDLLYGTIAQEVVAAGGTPVLLLKPVEADSSFSLKHILVPLDNESVHDSVLPLAVQLAKASSAQLDLLCVIPTLGTDSGEHAAAGTMLPMTAAAYLDIAEDIAHEHFQAHLEQFEEAGIPATAEIARGDPAQVIARTAERLAVDLILFGTHGRSGLDAFWNRSITAAVARHTKTPLLLIPVRKDIPAVKE
jgi:nucleotide-binding universal stress UspA family protein